MDELDFLKREDIRTFIIENEHVDVQKLVLNPPETFKNHIRLIADQIISRRKLKNKLPEWVESLAILTPPVSAEQASSQETSRYKASLLQGDQLVDLTGGTGVDTIALSTNFKSTTYVEPDPWLCKLFEYNHHLLTSKDIKIWQSTAEEFLNRFTGQAVFYIDPSRRTEKNKVFLLEDCVPNILKLLPEIKKKGSEVLIKLSPMLDIKEGIRKLRYVKTVHVVCVKNECKELLFHLDLQHVVKTPEIHCVNLISGKPQLFKFTFEQEKTIRPTFSQPLKYIYDPNSSILKAGAFNTVSQNFSLDKISSNTHLYTSSQLINDFPGRCFAVHEYPITPKTKKDISGNQVNVITKNYPLSSEALCKKLKVKDGGEKYLLGFRDHQNKAVLVLCERIY